MAIVLAVMMAVLFRADRRQRRRGGQVSESGSAPATVVRTRLSFVGGIGDGERPADLALGVEL